MIRVEITYTESLGPEAEIPELLGRIVERLAREGPVIGDNPFVFARPIVEFVRLEAAAWDTVLGRVTAPPEAVEAFTSGLLGELLAMTEAHLSELAARRSIQVAFDLESPPASLERLHPRPASAPSF